MSQPITSQEIEDFKDNWGQSHEEACSNLGYDEDDSDELLMEDFFWDEIEELWLNKEASGFTPREQEIADHLRHGS